MTFSDTDNDSGWQLGADDNDQSWFVVKGFTTASGALNTTFQGARNSASLCIYSATNRVFMNKGSGVSTGSGSTLEPLVVQLKLTTDLFLQLQLVLHHSR